MPGNPSIQRGKPLNFPGIKNLNHFLRGVLMKKWLIIALLVVGALFVPAVSAADYQVLSMPYSDEKSQQLFDYYTSDLGQTNLYSQNGGPYSNLIVSLSTVQYYNQVHYFKWETPSNYLTEGDTTVWYCRPSDDTYHTALLKVSHTKNILGQVTKTVAYLFPDDWEVGTKTGAWSTVLYNDNNGVKSSTPIINTMMKANKAYYSVNAYNNAGGNVNYMGYMGLRYTQNPFTQSSYVEGYTNVRYALDIEESGASYVIDITRIISGSPSVSTVKISDTSEVLIYEDTDSIDRQFLVNKDVLKSIEIVTGTYINRYFFPAITIPSESLNYSVTVYAQNADTGALINSVALGCKNAETLEWTNSTIDGGWTVIELPAGNYEFHGTATGFYQPAPGRLTVDGVGDNLALLLYPVGGTPPAGNVTLQVWCNYGVLGDGNRYGVPGAEVSIVGIVGEGIGYSSGILTANEQGFVTVEAPGNTSYSAYGSKIGYISGETEFSVLTGSPVHVSISLTPGAVPTEPPITPTPTVTPTPTETPVPGGFMDDAGNGIAQLFGVSLAVGKMLLGFLIALAVGMGTAKQLEGGAPEFVVGFTGAAFLSTVAGLIPIGFFVLVAVLAGIYLGKSYIGGGEGGR